MNAVLYMQVDTNIQIKHPHIYLKDIARLSCSDSKILNRLRVMPVVNLKPDAPGRYVMSVMDLVDRIQQKESDLTVTPLGETDFILTYEQPGSQNLVFRWLKIALVCLITFFGAAFSIMTFNADVDVEKLFQQIYFQVTGQNSSGFTPLEIAYSAGLGLGILFFFNHFGHRKITADPTPMQVQMRKYEDDVNTTITENIFTVHK